MITFSSAKILCSLIDAFSVHEHNIVVSFRNISVSLFHAHLTDIEHVQNAVTPQF